MDRYRSELTQAFGIKSDDVLFKCIFSPGIVQSQIKFVLLFVSFKSNIAIEDKML